MKNILFYSDLNGRSNRLTLVDGIDNKLFRIVKIGSIRLFTKNRNRRVLWALNQLSTAVKIIYVALTRRTRDVIVSSPREGLFVCAFSRIFHLPLRIVIWPFNIGGTYRQPLLGLAKFAYQYVRCIVVYSQHEKEIYEKMFKIPSRKIVFKLIDAPYAEDDTYRQIFKEKCMNDYVVVPGYSGRDFSTISKVAAHLPYRFIFLTYPHVLKNIHIPNNVEVVSGVSEEKFCQIIANAKICVVPLLSDIIANGHIAFAQAMIFGTPLIATLLPGTNDYLINEVNSLIVEHSDAQNLKTVIIRLIEDPYLQDELRKNGIEFSRTHYSLAASTKLIDILFGE